MTLIVEDGSNVPGAQTYVSETDAVTYATARGYTFSQPIDQVLLAAMDWLEAQQFIGIRGYYIQSLQWPRLKIMIDLYWVQNNTIPQLLKDCECEIAIAIDNGEAPFASIPDKITKIRASNIEIDYLNGSASTPINRKIMLKLQKLIVGGGGFSTMRA
jgi:hypothetical protein